VRKSHSREGKQGGKRTGRGKQGGIQVGGKRQIPNNYIEKRTRKGGKKI